MEEARSLWLLTVRAEGRSPKTLKAYTEHLTPFARFLVAAGLSDVDEVTPFHIRRFLVEYGPGRSPKTLHSVYGAVRTFFRFLVAEGMLTVSPTEKVKAPKVPQLSKEVYSPGELRAILKTLERRKTALGLRDYALVSILADTGARAGEVLALGIDDLDDGALLLRQTKGKRPRMLPLGEKARVALWAYITRGRPKLRPRGKELFVTDDGRPLSYNGLRCSLSRLGKALGFPISAHKFRHTWATMMLRKGVDLETLRRMGGWGDYQMLKTYSHLSVEDLKEAQRRHSLVDGL